MIIDPDKWTKSARALLMQCIRVWAAYRCILMRVDDSGTYEFCHEEDEVRFGRLLNAMVKDFDSIPLDAFRQRWPELNGLM
jgi:hypothetical protein